MIIAILLFIGIVVMNKQEAKRRTFWKVFGYLGAALLLVYWVLDPSIILRPEDLLGLLFLDFLIAMFVALVKEKGNH